MANITKIAGFIFFVLFINMGIPMILDFMNVNVVDYYTPIQVFIMALIVLYFLLPQRVYNPFM